MGRMQKPTLEMASRYMTLFANRGAFTVQTHRPDAEGRYYYFRPSPKWFDWRGWPEEERRLCPQTILRHLKGDITVALYSINPDTQRSKWIAIDADYEQAFEHLLRLQQELKKDGVHSALERSRRGAHLWVFMSAPVLAQECRLYICNVAVRMGLPIKTSGKTIGLEIFPRQDRVESDEFGNAIRGPLGIHRGAAGKRFWFYDADFTFAAQLDFLERLEKFSEERLRPLIQGLTLPEALMPRLHVPLPPYDPNRREFRILDFVPRGRKSGKDYRTKCPSCGSRDKKGDNLAVNVADPRKYRCWAGCSKEEIRAAVGRPIRSTWGTESWQSRQLNA